MAENLDKLPTLEEPGFYNDRPTKLVPCACRKEGCTNRPLSVYADGDTGAEQEVCLEQTLEMNSDFDPESLNMRTVVVMIGGDPSTLFSALDEVLAALFGEDSEPEAPDSNASRRPYVRHPFWQRADDEDDRADDPVK